ncbi:MAG: hotdog fold domain-containing protein [Stagnimonas sp.]|nr:hotdog fold domain-containing protein [Stagnimonas sp.]
MSATEKPRLLKMWDRALRLPLGPRVFTRAFQLAAPYFNTLPMVFTHAEPGLVRAKLKHVRKVHNHIGTVHAIALCNLAEAVMGLAAEVSIPSSHRWIPKGMTVAYLAKARGTMHAEAVLVLPKTLADKQEIAVPVSVRDPEGVEVFTAEIRIWVTAKPPQS